jgi:biopolymer transport protein ExbD/biopolymer transport protein TolR
MSKNPSSKPQPEPEINVTPLVDVVLVLLIIFMVIAPQLEHGERVELPGVFKPDEKSKSKLDPITVTMTASGRFFLEKEPIADLAALKNRLSEIRARDPERRVVLKGDATLRYDKMRETFAACQQIGFSGVSLSVSQRGRKAAADEG